MLIDTKYLYDEQLCLLLGSYISEVEEIEEQQDEALQESLLEAMQARYDVVVAERELEDG